jgi:NDP-sugar pyrophosphorylase family protein
MGPLKLIKDLPENFLVMNGDILTDLNFAEFFDEHVKNNSIFTISSFEREQKSEFGVLGTDQGNLVEFREKPVMHFEVSMGVYMVSKRVVSKIPEGLAYGFDQLMLQLIADKIYARAKKFKGFWLDIGRAEDYELAIEVFKDKKEIFFK